MRILYFDCFSGISGDMTVGALADLGVTPSTFEWELSNFEIGDFHLHFERQTRKGISGVKFDVHGGATHVDHVHDDHSSEAEADPHENDDEHHAHEGHQHEHEHQGHHEHNHPRHDDDQHPHHHHEDHHHDQHDEEAHPHPGRSFSGITALVNSSGLSPFVKKHATSIFRRIAEAESKIHAVPIDKVQFHELGALDSIVDVVLTCIGIEALKVDQIHFSELTDGIGFIRCSHGNYPLPAPATLELLRGLPIRQVPVPFELITPTGAAIVAEFQISVGPMPRLRPSKIGYGLGTRDLPDHPNVLRVLLADSDPEDKTESVVEVQANIDDLSPEILGATIDRLLAAGAVDAYFTPVQMKKSRPATLLTVLCPRQNLEAVQAVIFKETTTFGLRYQEMERVTLDREQVEVETGAGPVVVKIGRFHKNLLQVSPEFESCQSLASKSGISLRRIYEMAVSAFWMKEERSS